MDAPMLFSGFAQVYIEGKGALSPFSWSSSDEVIYFLGSPASQYKIIDRRIEVNEMAVNAINNGGLGWSPQKFCKPCYIVISKDRDGLTIQLQNLFDGQNEFPVIWMGIMEGDSLPAQPVVWLQYMDIEDGKAAFVGVIDPALSPFSTQTADLVGD